MSKPIPKLGSIEYRIIFYHHVTSDILKYKFKSLSIAEDFFSKLDPVTSKPVMYKVERIR